MVFFFTSLGDLSNAQYFEYWRSRPASMVSNGRKITVRGPVTTPIKQALQTPEKPEKNNDGMHMHASNAEG